MTKAMSAFYPWVMPQVPGCPDILLDQAIRQSAVMFCDETNIIQQVAASNIVAGTEDYAITPPTDMKLTCILSASWYTTTLGKVSPADVNDPLALRGLSIGTAIPLSGSPQYYFQKTPSDTTVSLYPIPDTALTNGLVIKASFSPTNTAVTVDDILFDDWVEDIAAGAISRLMIMPGQPFSNTTMAAVYAKQYAMGIDTCNRIKHAGQLNGPLRVMQRLFV